MKQQVFSCFDLKRTHLVFGPLLTEKQPDSREKVSSSWIEGVVGFCHAWSPVFHHFFDMPLLPLPIFAKNTYVNGGLEPYHWFHVSAFFLPRTCLTWKYFHTIFLLEMVAFKSTSSRWTVVVLQKSVV